MALTAGLTQFIRPIYTQVCRCTVVREGLASLAHLFCYMHRHLVYEGACSDVTHTAFVLCVVGMEKRHLIRDQRCEGWLIPMVRSIRKSKNDSVFM